MHTNTLLSFLCFSFAIVSAAPSERKKVLVLGAGAAGVTAAKTLHDKGITDFLVLEGQDYIGGRMKVVPFAGIKVELGANWIHYFDEEENPLVPLRDKHNLRGHLSNYSNVRARYQQFWCNCSILSRVIFYYCFLNHRDLLFASDNR